MEGERRKRKLEDEEECEEQKMEKFFALIKSTRDARDLLCSTSKEKTDHNKVEENKKEKGIWNPTFQLEDFIGCGEFGKINNNISVTNHIAAGPSEKEKEVVTIEKQYLQLEVTTAAEAPADESNEEKEKEKASDDHLDLNLSL